MNTYVVITLAIIAGPFLLSFDKRVGFHRHWLQLGISMVPVSAAYLLWDVLVTEQGHWSFNPAYAGSWKLFGLPLGEWLFFLVVPYACIFILEVVRAYFPNRTYSDSGRVRTYAIVCVVLLLVTGYLFRGQSYTLLALLATSVWLTLTLIAQPGLLGDSHNLWFFLLSIIAFLVVNGILTGLPIVLYTPEAIWGVRIASIPLEDLFYNISMLGLYLLSYETVGNLLHRKGTR